MVASQRGSLAKGRSPMCMTCLPPWPCRTVILVGGLLPLAMFVSWEAVALNLLPAALAGTPAAATEPLGSAPVVDLMEVGAVRECIGLKSLGC